MNWHSGRMISNYFGELCNDVPPIWDVERGWRKNANILRDLDGLNCKSDWKSNSVDKELSSLRARNRRRVFSPRCVLMRTRARNHKTVRCNRVLHSVERRCGDPMRIFQREERQSPVRPEPRREPSHSREREEGALLTKTGNWSADSISRG